MTCLRHLRKRSSDGTLRAQKQGQNDEVLLEKLKQVDPNAEQNVKQLSDIQF